MRIILGPKLSYGYYWIYYSVSLQAAGKRKETRWGDLSRKNYFTLSGVGSLLVRRSTLAGGRGKAPGSQKMEGGMGRQRFPILKPFPGFQGIFPPLWQNHQADNPHGHQSPLPGPGPVSAVDNRDFLSPVWQPPAATVNLPEFGNNPGVYGADGTWPEYGAGRSGTRCIP